MTMDESSNGRAKGQTSTKHPREDFDDGELDRETFVIRDEAAIDVVAGQGLEEEQVSALSLSISRRLCKQNLLVSGSLPDFSRPPRRKAGNDPIVRAPSGRHCSSRSPSIA